MVSDSSALFSYQGCSRDPSYVCLHPHCYLVVAALQGQRQSLILHLADSENIYICNRRGCSDGFILAPRNLNTLHLIHVFIFKT